MSDADPVEDSPPPVEQAFDERRLDRAQPGADHQNVVALDDLQHSIEIARTEPVGVADPCGHHAGIQGGIYGHQ